MQHGECEVKWMNPKLGQGHASLDVRRKKLIGFVLFCFVWFYGISTIVGYLMPSSFLYI